MKTGGKKFIPLIERGSILLKKNVIFLQEAESAGPCGWIVGSASVSVAPSGGERSIGVLEGPYVGAQGCLFVVNILK